MNLGDGLLFELENGKPKLILLSHGVEKNPKKQLPFRPRVANILSSRQPSCVEEVQEERSGRHREPRSRAEGAATPLTSNTVTTGGRSTTLTSSKTPENNKGGSVKTVAKVKSERQKHNTNVGALRANGKTRQPQRSVTQGSGKDLLASGNTGPKDSMVCLTNEQLQQILSTVQTLSNGHHPTEDHRTQDGGNYGNQIISKSGTSMNGREGEMKQEDSGGGKEIKNIGGEGVSDTTRSSPDKDNRLSGCLFSWLEERQSDSRVTINAKKAQWRRELDKQVALKQQQRSPSGRLQAEEDRESVLSVRSSISYKEQPAAIKSSLKIGEVTPVEEVLSVEKRDEQRRRWLEELDRQREETTERRRREKLLQSQMEDHELWATHFDSLQRRPPVQTAAPPVPAALPPAPSSGSERGEWEPSSRLSLVWETTSNCGAESVGAASVDTTNGIHQTKASYLRTMTALLDPAQIEERERRRLKQLEQQRAIEAQVEERRRQREQAEARRREEDEEEERRVALEREMLQRKYDLDSKRERQKEKLNHQEDQTKAGNNDERLQESLESSTLIGKDESLGEVVSSLVSPYKDTAVQTEATPSISLRAEKVQAPAPLSTAPPNSRSQVVRTGKENIRLQGGGDSYEAFARTDRNQRDKRRPEWNTQRPSRRYVPASERYPAVLQRNRQESRLKRQAELLALQERACLSRTDLPPQSQEPRLCSNATQTRTSPNKKVESVSGQSISAATTTERGHSPPVPAVRHRVQSQHASSPSPPVLEFIPYVRTDEVFNLDPLEPAETPPPDTHAGPPQVSASPPAPSHRDPLLHPELLCNAHTHRQQEILRGLAQLRQGLLQKQRELETDLNPLLKRHDEFLSPSGTHHVTSDR